MSEKAPPPLMFAAQPGTVLRIARAVDEGPIVIKYEDRSVVAWSWENNKDMDEAELVPWVLGAGSAYRWEHNDYGGEIMDAAIVYEPQSLSESLSLHPSWEIVSDEAM